MQISTYRNFSKRVLEKVLDNQLDVGIVTLPVNGKDLVVIPIAKDELWLITSPSHPLAGRSSVSLIELVDYPLIFHKVGSTRERILQQFGKAAEKLNIPFELASIETVKKFVSIGMSIAVVPKSYALEERDQGVLNLVRIKDLKMIRRLGLIYKKNRYMSRACKAFLEVIEECLSTGGMN